jgi:hypothetical protein
LTGAESDIRLEQLLLSLGIGRLLKKSALYPKADIIGLGIDVC